MLNPERLRSVVQRQDVDIVRLLLFIFVVFCLGCIGPQKQRPRGRWAHTQTCLLRLDALIFLRIEWMSYLFNSSGPILKSQLALLRSLTEFVKLVWYICASRSPWPITTTGPVGQASTGCDYRLPFANLVSSAGFFKKKNRWLAWHVKPLANFGGGKREVFLRGRTHSALDFDITRYCSI